MEKLKIEDLCPSGFFKKEDFEKKLEEIDWKKFRDKGVLIEGCGSVLLPSWAYMMITAKLISEARIILYGEPSNPILIYKKI